MPSLRAPMLRPGRSNLAVRDRHGLRPRDDDKTKAPVDEAANASVVRVRNDYLKLFGVIEKPGVYDPTIFGFHRNTEHIPRDPIGFDGVALGRRHGDVPCASSEF